MSTASPARIEANKRNAEHSTGPKTPEGKAIARANSLKHGMTGDGVVVPANDLSRISAIADELREKYQPSTPSEDALVERAAMLTVRLSRCGKHEVALVEDSVAQALFDFDQYRLDAADALLHELPDDPSAFRKLMAFPEGVDRLIAEWRALEATDKWSPEDVDRVALLTDACLEDAPSFARTIPDVIARLEAAKLAIDPRHRDVARKRAADLAQFPMSPEAILARKYDSATDRALDKTMKALRELGTIEETPAASPEAPQTPRRSRHWLRFLPNDQSRSRFRPRSSRSPPRSTQTPRPPESGVRTRRSCSRR